MIKHIDFCGEEKYLPRDYFLISGYDNKEIAMIGKVMKIIYPELKNRWSEDFALGHDTMHSFCSKEEYIKLFLAYEQYKGNKAFY